MKVLGKLNIGQKSICNCLLLRPSSQKTLSLGFQTLKNCRSPGSNVCCSSHMSLPIYDGDGLAQKFCLNPGFQMSKIDWKILKSQKISTRTPKDHYIEAPCHIWRCCDDWYLVFILVKRCKNFGPLWPTPAILTPAVLMPKSWTSNSRNPSKKLQFTEFSKKYPWGLL